LPDISDVDLAELQLMILTILDQRGLGPEWRRCMRKPQIGDLLDLAAGGAREVLMTALAALRRR
jgi:hypothetical protein